MPPPNLGGPRRFLEMTLMAMENRNSGTDVISGLLLLLVVVIVAGCAVIGGLVVGCAQAAWLWGEAFHRVTQKRLDSTPS